MRPDRNAPPMTREEQQSASYSTIRTKRGRALVLLQSGKEILHQPLHRLRLFRMYPVAGACERLQRAVRKLGAHGGMVVRLDVAGVFAADEECRAGVCALRL